MGGVAVAGFRLFIFFMPFQKLSEASRAERSKAGHFLTDFSVKRILCAEDFTDSAVMGEDFFHNGHIHGRSIGETGDLPIRKTELVLR